MITVVGFNTAIDRRIDVVRLQPGAVQRATTAAARPGGKGLHVAETVAALGEPVRLVGLAAGADGAALAERLRGRRVEWHPVPSSGPLRQCLAIHEADGRITEILEPGPTLDARVCAALLAAAREAMAESDFLVFTGSLPGGLPPDTYATLIGDARAHGVRCLLDASAAALRAGIDAQPWLVKPNADEAAAVLGRPVRGVDDGLACVHLLHRRGIAWSVVTLGALGAVGFDGTAAWHATSAAPVAVQDSVGSGDCFLAGLAVGAVRGESLKVALRRAVACGIVNAESPDTGYASLERVLAWLPRVTVAPLPAPPAAIPDA